MVTRVTIREVSYKAVDGPFAGTVPQWKFLDQFQPVPAQKNAKEKKALRQYSLPTSNDRRG
jgi:hypothetical protein